MSDDGKVELKGGAESPADSPDSAVRAQAAGEDEDEAAFFAASKAKAPAVHPAEAGFHIEMDEVMEGMSPEAHSGNLLASKRHGRGLVSSLIGIAVSVFFLAGLAGELAFWAFGPSKATPIWSCKEDMTPARLDDGLNGLVQVSGVPSGTAVRFRRRFVLKEIVAVKDSPVAVERRATGMAAQTGNREAPPDMAPFEAKGRLVRDDELGAEYAQAFKMLAGRRELIPEGGHFYLVSDGEIPRSAGALPLMGLGLLLLLGVNIRLLRMSLKKPARH